MTADSSTIRKLDDTGSNQLLDYLHEMDNYNKYNKIELLYPDTGPLRRELYPKHMQFFKAGKKYSERAAVAANRVGKSYGIGGYETTLHLTGRYPDWWEGRRFHHPTEVWAAGDTSETTRDIVQNILLGQSGDFGTGLIPKSCIIGSPTHRAGVAGAVDTVMVKHSSGGMSMLGLKSFDQGRKKFQGTAKDLCWLDEEAPMDVYTECLTRTMTKNGMMICTFTPLEGLSDVVLMYLPELAPSVSGDNDNEDDYEV